MFLVKGVKRDKKLIIQNIRFDLRFIRINNRLKRILFCPQIMVNIRSKANIQILFFS
jgi:hypothetical protein